MALITGLTNHYWLEDNSLDNYGTANGTDTSMSYGSPYIVGTSAAQYDGAASTNLFTVGLGSAGTLNVWFKRFDTTTNVTSLVGATTIGVHDYIRVAPNNTNINMQLMDDNKNYAWTVDTNWHMLTLVWDGSTAWEGYLDGVKVITGTGVKNPTGNSYVRTGIVDNNGTPYTSGQTWYKGTIQSLSFFNTRKTGTEITQLYNAGTPYKFVDLTTSIAAAYNLNESSGNAADASGNGKTLTNTNSVTYTAAHIGNGMQGGSPTDNYLTIADALGFSAAASMTWNFWFNSSSTFAGYLLANISNATDHLYAIVYCNTSNRITLFANANERTSSSLSTNTWYMVTVIKYGTTWALFINNSQVGATVSTGSGNYTGGVGFMLGNSLYSGGSPTPSIIDDVLVYNRILSTSERTQLYTTTSEYPFSTFMPRPNGLRTLQGINRAATY